jgi:hypothetical protein
MSLTARLGMGLRWCAIAAVFLTTAELFARVDDWVTWGAPLLSPYNHDRLLMHDSLGIRGRPGYRYEKWRMNNEGFRGADMSLTTAPGRVRVVVIGASETFGLYESEGREYPARLQTLLDSIAPGRFDVINVGLPGMSLSAMVPYYRNLVARLNPRYVLIYPSPSFYLEVTPLPAVYTPPRVDPRVAGAATRRWPPPRDFFESRLGAKGRDVLKELIPPSLVTAYREWRLRRLRAGQEPGWVWQSVPEDRMAILREHLERLIPSIRATGAEVVLLTHTNRFIGAPGAAAGPDRRHLVNLIAAYYPRATEHVMVAVDSAANTIIRQVAQAEGAPVVEVEGRIPPGGADFADYAHFTDAGADAMARILADGLLRLERPDSLSVGAGQRAPGRP